MLVVPQLSLVVLIGASGSGKTTFARRHFKPTEVLSSDYCRGLVADDETDQAATKAAFDVLHFIARQRLAAGRLTVIDATNVRPGDRASLVALAREFHALPVGIVLDLPPAVCKERNRARTDRPFGGEVIARQCSLLRRGLRGLKREGFTYIYVLRSPEEVDAAVVQRRPLYCDRRDDRGPFDIIGDLHGCAGELERLLGMLGYRVADQPATTRLPIAGCRLPIGTATGGSPSIADMRLPAAKHTGGSPVPQCAVPTAGSPEAGPGAPSAGSAEPQPRSVLYSGPVYLHPEGRRLIFLGDVGDRGPRILDCFRIVASMVQAGHALCVPGNHDVKLLKKLRGQEVRVSHGLAATLREIDALPAEDRDLFCRELHDFLDSLTSHYVLDGGRLVVAHAGMKQEMQGRGSGAVRSFALYGETTGETDEFGLPVRYNWAAEYRGRAAVVYGHTPVPRPEWLNNTINIDTGCVFGGALTALRWPERELVSVPAERVYFESVKPFALGPSPAAGAADPAVTADRDARLLTAQQLHDDLLDIDDVRGKRIITTRLRASVTIHEENAAAALEAISRFAIHPKWLIYLPPTMSPCETTRLPGLLEHPTEAFDHYRRQGVGTVICEEKHMGSRAVVIVCRDQDAARRRFGVVGEGPGAVYTRTGKRFFADTALEAGLLERLRAAIDAAGWWTEFGSDWFCLDCELMPWSVKAQELLRSQYAAVGAAARAALPEAVAALEQAAARGVDTAALLDRHRERAVCAERFTNAYREYCWPVSGLADLKLAPFHLLASEGAVHADKDHRWHMETLRRACAADESLLLATPYEEVDLHDEAAVRRGIAWWEELTSRGGEGMVVKPLAFVTRGRHGLVQPAIKCRGREYLRIIYGPEYTMDEHLTRLRERGLARKRSLAIREFALGIEALERFVAGEPLRRVHECVFGVLALESEPVDPRL